MVKVTLLLLTNESALYQRCIVMLRNKMFMTGLTKEV